MKTGNLQRGKLICGLLILLPHPLVTNLPNFTIQKTLGITRLGIVLGPNQLAGVNNNGK